MQVSEATKRGQSLCPQLMQQTPTSPLGCRCGPNQSFVMNLMGVTGHMMKMGRESALITASNISA
ncbi:MAG: hypothetical protein Q7L55_08975 [Actinomycetota bacterium]|nr:hypothetical protein [Actinomycetota bacterium]